MGMTVLYAIHVKSKKQRKDKKNKCDLPDLHVSVNGIGPLSKAYESFVLPLNYTDSPTTIPKIIRLRNHILRKVPICARIGRPSRGRATVARQAHNLKIDGSIPSPATSE